MQNSITFRRFVNKNAYLLVTAAWLLTISFVVDNYWSADASLLSVQKQVAKNIHRQEKDFSKLLGDTAYMRMISKGAATEDVIKRLMKKQYFLFFYHPDSTGYESLVCWNTQQVIPFPSLLYEKRSKGFVKLKNGYFVWSRYKKDNLKVLALIPVKWDYIVENDYLKNDFVNVTSISGNFEITTSSSNAAVVKSLEGKALFFIREKVPDSVAKNNPIAIGLRISAILIVLLFIHFCSSYLAATKQLWKALVFLFVSILVVRTIGFQFNLPLNFRQFALFDPAIYSSSQILRSLGDLLINAFLFVWFILFLRYHFNEKSFTFLDFNKKNKWLLLSIGGAIIMATTFAGSYVVQSLVADSKISFDVLNFFTLNIYSVLGFVVLCCLAIGYYFLCQIILYCIKPFFQKGFIPLFLFITVAGLVLLTFRIGSLGGGFEIYVLLWLLFFLFLLNNERFNLISSKIISSKLVFWLFFFSVSITAIIVVENNNKELNNRLHYAEMLATKADPSTETLVNSMLTPFREDFLTYNFNRFFEPASNSFLKDSLVNENTTSYSERYQTQVYTYSSDERPLYNTDSTSYNEINTILNTQSRPTGIKGLYFFDKSYDMFSYINKKTLYDDSGNLVGYVFILASPKKQKTDALSPELFGKGAGNSIENSSLYSFAIYNNWRLVRSHNDYAFPSVIHKREFSQEPRFIKKRNHSELWYYAGADRMIVIAKENSNSLESITLFSYLFCSFLLISALFWLLNVIIRSRLNANKFRSYLQLSIRSQIHGTIIFVSVLSFFVIGFATILFFISRYENNNRERLSRTIRIMEKEIKNSLNDGWHLQDSLDMNKKAYEQKFQSVIANISEIHDMDVNLYDLYGNLRVSSLPLPYIKGIVSTKMHPLAYYHLNKLKEVQYFQKENIGALNFVSNYVPIFDAQGNEYAFLNIPYFTSQSNLKQEISNFLVAIINLNAFIFLLAGIVALFITNRITNSFSVISDKMKRINLGEQNEMIAWKRDDELGSLVNEYNKMVSKLEKSAQSLAKNEREGAWKEMARQVAHEIKNPLTPMKLSMQFLQKSIENNAPNVKELSARVAQTLVEQIDHLSQIASEFSQFANIEHSKEEVLDINSIVNNVLGLYSSNENVQINSYLLNAPVVVNADKSHLTRLFTNLLLNAIQAVPSGNPARIDITESVSTHNVLIQIKDNGIGINEEIKSKIFTPNFTTKTSGTGLGLAMCKRMVEQANGRIWFETEESKGTIFFIELPLLY